MEKIIKYFNNDKNYVYFGKGAFDDFCVYLKLNNRDVFPPRDYMYFNFFIEMKKKYGKEKIYNDFCQIYEQTDANVNNEVLQYITNISKTYEEQDELDLDIWFTVIYLGMIAEENKKNTILKKRIKRLGFHQIIMEDYSAYDAANFSKGKNWKNLDSECKNRGF